MPIIPSWNPKEYIRVIKLASKPSNQEMKVVAGVSGAGLAIVGLIGMVIFALMSLIPV